MAELLNNMNVWMVLYCAQQLWVLKKQKPFLHLSFTKADPLVLEIDICVKAVKCKVFQIIRCLIKPLLKNSTQTIFQGGTPWVAELLNNMNAWMVLYCAQQLLGVKKIFLHLSLGKGSRMSEMSKLSRTLSSSALWWRAFCLLRAPLK